MSLHLALDHVVVLVPDLALAGAAFEGAGFYVTPQTEHSAAMGTANRCVMLHGGSYIEIMGIVTQTPANAPWRALLRTSAGIRGLAFASDDIETTASALSARGIATEPVRHFSRMTGEGELRFSVTRIDPSETPGLQCLACQHHTADLLWRADTMTHDNGADRLVSMTVPQADRIKPFADLDGKVRVGVGTGSDRLVLSGARRQVYDLRSVCGVELEIVPA